MPNCCSLSWSWWWPSSANAESATATNASRDATHRIMKPFSDKSLLPDVEVVNFPRWVRNYWRNISITFIDLVVGENA